MKIYEKRNIENIRRIGEEIIRKEMEREDLQRGEKNRTFGIKDIKKNPRRFEFSSVILCIQI